MKKFIKNNRYVILVITILCGIMFYFINEKQGFHEDEIFSYGASNYRYDNVYRPYGYADAYQDVFYNQVLKGSFKDKVNNTIRLIKDQDSFSSDEDLLKETPIWKTREEALNYLTIQKEDIFGYFHMYVNIVRDVHPPLFYYFVHGISTLFYNTFTKYIIFTLNLIFFIGTLITINGIMKKLDKEKLSIPTMILYGTSMACISTVMFQRMYMMLTFFCVLYLYLTINYIKNDFKINKKWPWLLTVVGGFLTQYHFCVYISLIFILISIYLIFKKRFKDLLKYFLVHVYSAIIGIILYPDCIEDIFFSYRGIGSKIGHSKTFMENFTYYINQIVEQFGLSKIIYFIIGFLFGIIFYKIIKKQIHFKKDFNVIILLLPIILFIAIISKIAPFLGEAWTSRYIMLLFPIIVITTVYLLSFVFKTKYFPALLLILSIILSIYTLTNNTPTYLYNDNKKVMELANNNKDKYFVYIFDNYFTHISSLPEFATYKSSLIIDFTRYDFKLLNNDELNSVDEFILCIKKWVNQDETLNKVLTNTGYSRYELLLELNSDVEAYYYRVVR